MSSATQIEMVLTDTEITYLVQVITSTFKWRYQTNSDHMDLFQRLTAASQELARRKKHESEAQPEPCP